MKKNISNLVGKMVLSPFTRSELGLGPSPDWVWGKFYRIESVRSRLNYSVSNETDSLNLPSLVTDLH